MCFTSLQGVIGPRPHSRGPTRALGSHSEERFTDALVTSRPVAQLGPPRRIPADGVRPSPPTNRSAAGPRPSPTPACAPPSSTGSPSPERSSKPAPPATDSPTPEAPEPRRGSPSRARADTRGQRRLPEPARQPMTFTSKDSATIGQARPSGDASTRSVNPLLPINRSTKPRQQPRTPRRTAATNGRRCAQGCDQSVSTVEPLSVGVPTLPTAPTYKADPCSNRGRGRGRGLPTWLQLGRHPVDPLAEHEQACPFWCRNERNECNQSPFSCLEVGCTTGCASATNLMCRNECRTS